MANNDSECRKISCNFSIDHILNRAGDSVRNSNDNDNVQEKVQNGNSHEMKMILNNSRYHQYTFQWLNCSRYHPPKLPRIQKREGAKRQPGRHPRIPFSAIQLETLEESYKKSQYLCPEEVSKLSTKLNLSDARIKIWFQNRRAREKREKHGLLKNESQKSALDKCKR